MHWFILTLMGYFLWSAQPHAPVSTPVDLGKSPVSWVTTSQKISNGEYKIIFTANIEDGWNIYSQYLANDEGPVRTSFTFTPSGQYELIGKNEESGDIKKAMDEMFGMEVIKIKHKGVFTQKIKASDTSKPITGFIEFMCCNELQCLPPKQIPFTVDLRTAN